MNVKGNGEDSAAIHVLFLSLGQFIEIKQIKSKMKCIYSLFILFIGLTLWACTKSSTTGNQSPTRIRLINAMPGKSFDLVLNEEVLAAEIPYDSATDFMNGPAGFYKLLIRENGSVDTIINGNQYLQAGEKYSLFLLPDSANRVEGVRLSVITDNDELPRFDSAKFRFFNFAPDTSSLTIVRLRKRGQTMDYDTIFPHLGIGRTYMDNSLNSRLGQYQTIFTDTYLFEFVNTNFPTTYVDSLSVQILRDRFYTFYFEGYDSLDTGPFRRKIKVLETEF